MKYCFIFLMIIFTCLLIPQRSVAWGMLGHRITGQIAESYLSPKAKKAIYAILGDSMIAMSSNWADFIRSDSAFKYADAWHYINVDDRLSYAGMQAYLKQDTAIDAYTRLMFLTNQLKNRKLPLDS